MPDRYIIDSRPQEQLCALLVDKTKTVDGITHIIQRGSFANHTSDRASDVDILLIVEDNLFESTIKILDTLIGSIGRLLYPRGWIDSIVPDFGGIGYVYILEYEGRLVHLDVYITPESWSSKILNISEKKILYCKPNFTSNSERKLTTSRETVEKYLLVQDVETEVIFEFLLVLLVATKQIFRSRPTLALKYRYAVIESLAKVIRLIYTPDRISYGFYEWNADLDKFRSPQIKRFERSIVRIDVFDDQELFDLLQLFKTLFFESKMQKKFSEFQLLQDSIKDYMLLLLRPEY